MACEVGGRDVERSSFFQRVEINLVNSASKFMTTKIRVIGADSVFRFQYYVITRMGSSTIKCVYDFVLCWIIPCHRVCK